MSTYLPQDLQDALERFIASKHGAVNKSEAIAMILRDWLLKQGYLPTKPEEGMPPEDLNATNDD
ncbi:hypothetical protein DUT91_05720 [Phyllobacterium salinisoli]|uniref:Uncharacterized protein n=1 Tax=Phyllobacterium salinisoli TaxID=1899321 RepID=A0A368K8Y7_9HYPH|nr:ribbon-helix-helix domain-containing protein [Phyllobacterium salinisoli]RCS24943.1 hypothetical protein DUT91_05720 [Phyllobacterium salinisoli]